MPSDRRDSVVRVVDDDPALLRSLALVLRAARLQVKTYDTAEAFLNGHDEAPGCALLDLRMSGRNGFELQEAILKMNEPLPVIFLTGRGDIQSSVRAMKRGAVDFLTKPVAADALLDSVQRALAIDRAVRRERHEHAVLQARYEALTAREREVFGLVATGLLNKQIAAVLGTSERTIKAHRANVMRKMKLESIANLARVAERLGARASRGD